MEGMCFVCTQVQERVGPRVCGADRGFRRPLSVRADL